MNTIDKAKFLNLMEELLELPPGQLTGVEDLASLRWDSLAVVGFLGAVDEHYGIALSPQLIKGRLTVNDLAALLDEIMTQRR